MEHEICRVKTFLKEFNEKIQSPTSDDVVSARINNYSLVPEEVFGQVVDWILNYLDNRKCPYPLAVSIAKEVASQISASFSEVSVAEGDFEKISNSASIYSDAVNKLPAVCSFLLEKENLETLCSSKYATSVFAIKNKRRKMEDRYVILHDLNTLLDFKNKPFQSYYAIFDGHSGIDAASYASAQLHLNIARHPDFFTHTPKAIMEGFQITDQKFLNKCNKEHIKSGCTAVIALIRENTVYLSWLGDSQAVLVKSGQSVTLTNPHKPDREDERNRIENLGGSVYDTMGVSRVNGLLAVSRAIGDPDQKKFITSEPELTVLDLDGTEDFLILACDGLWDGMSPEDVTGVLYRYLNDSSPGEPFDEVAAKLVHQSKLQGSEDNITTIVVFLRDVQDIIKDSSKFMTNSFPMPNFLSMNGNTKLFNMENIAEAHITKPTILELNSSSSKKLKNTANVLSSTGLESSSYSYQYVENPMEDSFKGMESLAGNSSQDAYLPQQNIAAACFAPETTALSELPTPPIDDMLASQQYDSFYSTDMYKEISASHSINIKTKLEQIVSNPDESIKIQSNDFPFAQPLDEIVRDVGNMKLQDEDVNVDTHKNPIDDISSNEAVAVASTVVSNTVETAVKCLSSTEADIKVQSQLNPYAKPFVMKSFFNEAESKSLDFEIDNPNTQTSPSFEDTKNSPVKENISDDLQNLTCFSENLVANSSEQNVISADFLTKISEQTNQSTVNEIVEQVNNQTVSEILEQTNQSTVTEIVEQVNNQTVVSEVSEQTINQTGVNEVLEQVVSTAIMEDISIEQIAQNVNDDLMSIDLSNDAKNSDVLHDSLPASEKETLEVSLNEVVKENIVKMESPNPLCEDMLVLIPDKELENNTSIFSAVMDESSLADKGTQKESLSSEKTENIDVVFDLSQNIVSEPIKEQKGDKIISDSPVNPESNQNFDLEALSVSMPGNEIEEKSQKKSKLETVEICAVENFTNNITKMECPTPPCEGISLVELPTSPGSKKIDIVDVVCSELPQDIISESIKEQESVSTVNLEELSTVENNQNSDLEGLSISVSRSELVDKSLQESKSEAFEECIVTDSQKEITNAPEPSILLEGITKDSLSLISIQNELNVSEAEVRSDHVIEDSKVETVAVDLKSLPEGIPEAEGVTEDVDSDSEKDGGWSYMKGNTVSGSKPKPGMKTTKAVKTSEMKSNAAVKTKKDVIKSTMEVKSTKTKSTLEDKSKALGDKTRSAVDKSKNITTVDKTKATASVDRNKKPLEKKTDIKDKTKVLKSTSTITSTKLATATSTKITVDKTSKVTSTVKKEVSETTSRATSTINKLSRPTTLARSNALNNKTTSSTKSITDKVNSKPTTNLVAKPKSNTGLLENKSNVRNLQSSVAKGQPSGISKPGVSSVRNVTARPLSAVSTKTTTVAKTTTIQKSAPAESKPKPPVNSMRRPLSATTQKPGVKEEKDTVNKQILAKRNIASKNVASTSLAPKRVASNKPTLNKVPSSTSKQELGKKDVPKPSTYRSIAKTTSIKPANNANKEKSKPAASNPSKAEQEKNALNIENDQKNVLDIESDKHVSSTENDQKFASDVAQKTAEEKYILESIDKEVIEKEKCEISNENPKIMENGASSETVTPVEDQVPTAECAPANL